MEDEECYPMRVELFAPRDLPHRLLTALEQLQVPFGEWFEGEAPRILQRVRPPAYFEELPLYDSDRRSFDIIQVE